MQDDGLVVGSRPGSRNSIGIIPGRPAYKMGGAVLVEVHTIEKWDSRDLIDHDLFQLLDDLLLLGKIRRSRVLAQQTICRRILPAFPVGGRLLSNRRGIFAIEQRIVEVEG